MIEGQQFKNLEIIGALDFDDRNTGVSPRRLPAWTRQQLVGNLDVMARMPSGVRIRFRTDSSRLVLKLLVTQFVNVGDQPRELTVDLESSAGEIDHQPVGGGNLIYFDRRDPTNFQLERGAESEITFSNLAPDDYELWLPQGAYVELRSMDFDAGAELAPASADTRPLWIHYGSSISHCVEADHPSMIWPAVAARIGGKRLQNLGLGGQCHLDQFIARTIRDLSPDLVSCKVGINIINGDTMRERVFVPALHGFLDTIREKLAQTPILLVSPIYCPSAENTPGPTLPNDAGKFVTVAGSDEIREGCMTLKHVRRLIEKVVQARGDPNLGYLDGLSLFSEADAGDLPDDLHPNPAGYIRMGERFASQAFGPDGFLKSTSPNS